MAVNLIDVYRPSRLYLPPLGPIKCDIPLNDHKVFSFNLYRDFGLTLIKLISPYVEADGVVGGEDGLLELDGC